ncbi:MAG: hypothetical protein CVU11_12915 [Bacteroidetes bacterium HGW-Bacteroidetes-6]|jgi:sensor histidine kinase YesM|nr:MAG: hypothetical protein CVU11_12915 [Bacteroidetes bacterium HGW-Bacteroidetes-6]
MHFFFEGYKNTFQRVLVHILFWLAYLSFYSMLVSIPSELTFFTLLLRTLYFLPVDIVVTYILIYGLLPFLIQKKYLLFTFLLLIVGFATLVLNQAIAYYIYLPKYYPENYEVFVEKYSFWHFDYFISLVGSLSVAFFASAIKLLKLWVRERQQKSILQMQNLQSEMALLKYQMNPHFIFNMLNNIDSLITIDPSKASESIMKLSEIMRYVLYEATADFVALNKEVNYLRNFISLHELKVGKQFIQFTDEIGQTSRLVAPMLFIPLVENAIKHGDKKAQQPGIKIRLFETDSSLCFEVQNQISRHEINKDALGGIGLPNLKRRLELLYPDSHHFTTEVSGSTYTAKICLQ